MIPFSGFTFTHFKGENNIIMLDTFLVQQNLNCLNVFFSDIQTGKLAC